MFACAFIIIFFPLVFIVILIKTLMNRLRYMKGESLIETSLDEFSENSSTRKVFKYYLKGVLPYLIIFILLAQQISLAIVMSEVFLKSFYDTKSYHLLLLRYMLMIVTYYMFAKDYKSVA
jgi:uncharacterized membrane protein